MTTCSVEEYFAVLVKRGVSVIAMGKSEDCLVESEVLWEMVMKYQAPEIIKPIIDFLVTEIKKQKRNNSEEVTQCELHQYFFDKCSQKHSSMLKVSKT